MKDEAKIFKYRILTIIMTIKTKKSIEKILIILGIIAAVLLWLGILGII